MSDQTNNVALFAKMSAVLGKLERLPKRGRNTHFNYDFVTDTDVSDAIRKALADEGIAFFAALDSVDKRDNKTIVYFTYTFADSKSGATFSCRWAGEADDKQDKGIAKAATSSLKYFFLKNFILSTGDLADDTDADIGGNGKEPQQTPQTAAKYKAAFFARVLAEIPYYNHVNHATNALKKLGFASYQHTHEDEYFAALQDYANKKANEEAE